MNSQQPNHSSMPFWDFMQYLDPSQASTRGVDHNNPPHFPPFFAGYPFGGPGPHGPPGSHPHGHGAHPPHGPPHGHGFEWGPWHYGPEDGPRGRRGRHHGRHGPPRRGDAPPEYEYRDGEDSTEVSDVERDGHREKDDTPGTMREDAPDPAEVTPEENDYAPPPRPPHGFGHRGRGGGGGGRRGRRGGRFGPHRGPGPHPGPGGMPFDFGGFMRGWASHPFFQNIFEHARRFQNNNGGNGNCYSSGDADADADNAFVPPVDIFNTERAFVLHVALPGAKKEDVGVNWDADRSLLSIAGVVHRPGDEAFLQTLASGERKVGVFERNVTLPPPEASGSERDEVDGLAITAKMENGVLIVTVPKLEKEWTEIHKVDIE